MLSGDGAAAKPDCIASLLKTRMVDREGEREERRGERKEKGGEGEGGKERSSCVLFLTFMSVHAHIFKIPL